MNASVLQVVGQIAGIGGLALGVFLLIFREVIRKNIFPNLRPTHAFRVIRLVVIATFLIAALGIAAWAYVQPSGRTNTRVVFPPQSAEPTISQHLQLMDAGNYHEAWNEMSQETHRRFQYDFVAKAFESQRRPLGSVVDRRLQGINMYQRLPDETPGAFATATYVTKYANATSPYFEAITTVAEAGEWKVLFHQVAPCPPGQCDSVVPVTK